VKDRLAETLLSLEEIFGVDNEDCIDVILTREEIANTIGTATESAIRLLSNLKKDGVIDLLGKKIKILNREFKRLKNRTEIDIKISVAFVNDNLNEEDQKELIELLTAMVTEHRKKHPIIFRKWLKKNNIK